MQTLLTLRPPPFDEKETMKRSNRVAGEGELAAIDSMALALMLLSHAPAAAAEEPDSSLSTSSGSAAAARTGGRVFECKTCSRRFPSFQALGGHRASHKKPKLLGSGSGEAVGRARVHECSVCGLEFAIGQALGGHMRRHRAVKTSMTEGNDEEKRQSSSPAAVPWLDLNVAPSEVAGGGDGLDVGPCRKKIFGFELAVDTSTVAVDCFH